MHSASLACCLSIGILCSVYGCGEQQQQSGPVPEVKVVPVVQKDVPVYREWVGQMYGAVDIEIRARVAGWLESMDFREGTEVKKGALLYTVDQTELRQAVAEAKGRLAQAQTLFARAKTDVDRYTPLAAAGAVSARDLESAQAEYGARKGEVDAAEASLRLAEVNLSYATIRAPIDGLIGISAARVGDFVGRPPNPVILNTISRVDSVHVRFSLTEQEYLELARRVIQTKGTERPRQKARLQLILADGSVYPEPGHVLYLQRQVDPATGTLQLEASFPNPDRLLRPGQFAKIRAAYEERKGAVLVPARAVSEVQGQSIVYAVDANNMAQYRALVPGPRLGALQVVQSGVQPGERVVIEGFQRLRPGMTVQATGVEFPYDSLAAALTGGRGGN